MDSQVRALGMLLTSITSLQIRQGSIYWFKTAWMPLRAI